MILQKKFKWVIEKDVHKHVPEERSELFKTLNAECTELEYINLLYSLILVTKPQSILETGTSVGLATLAMALGASKTNAHVTTIDQKSKTHIKKINDLKSFVTFVISESRQYLRNCQTNFDFAFLDSDLSCRAEEFQILLDRKIIQPGSLVCIHDTSKLRNWKINGNEAFWKEFEQNIVPRIESYIEFPLSRGMLVCKV
jgi:predicted O-methyltransferase YrrM